MFSIFKFLFRYNLKNKLPLIAITILVFLSASIFSSLNTLTINLNNSYRKLVIQGNLNNINIFENYSSVVLNNPILSGEDAKKENKKQFENELKNLNIDFRNFLSLELSNTQNGQEFKVIESEPNININKLVIYEGQDLQYSTFNFSEILTNSVWQKEDTNAIKARRDLIYVASLATWTNDIIKNDLIETWKLLKEPNNINEDPKTLSGIKNSVKNNLKAWTDETDPKYDKPINKDYSLAFSYNSGIAPIAGSIQNYMSYSSVVPTYVLKQQNKQVLPLEKFNEFKLYNEKEEYKSKDFFDKWFNTIDSKYKIKVDAQDYLIIGAGISPDFMYPIFSFEKLLPNITKESLLYVNKEGYQRTYDSARSSPIEDFIIAKYIQNNNISLDQMITKINDISKKYMSWGGVNAAYLNNDTSCQLSPSSARILFLPQLLNAQKTISTFLSLFIFLLTILISILFTKKFISDNQFSIAILRANGIRKRIVSWSTTIFSLFPSIIGGFFGYLLGFLLQTPLLSIYNFYWVIPTSLSVFNPFMLFLLIFFPLILISIVSVTSTYLCLKKNVNSLMNESSKFKVSHLSKIMSKSFSRLSIITRFRASLAFSSSSKILALLTVFTLMSTISMFAVTTLNSFEESKSLTFSNKKYNYSFDLITPTTQGGQYFRSTFDDLGKIIYNDKKEILNFNLSQTDSAYKKNKFNNNPLEEYSNIHLPSLNDVTWMKNDFSYLSNKVQMKPFLDVVIAGTTNPWDITTNLMPSNQVNLSNIKTKIFWESILSSSEKMIEEDRKYFVPPSGKGDITNAIFNSDFLNKTYSEILISQNFLIKTIDQNVINEYTPFYNGDYYIVDISQIGGLFSLKPKYVLFLTFLLSKYNISNNLYKVGYNLIPMDKEDETYTYIEGIFKTNNQNNNLNIKIKGIKPTSKHVALVNSNNVNLNSLLELENFDVNKDIHDYYLNNSSLILQSDQKIIINESAAFQYKLKIGDTISIEPINEATRIFYDKNKNNQNYKFEIVGINSTKQFPEFYINQKVANKILHLDNENIINTSFYNGKQINPFNGFFTTSDSPKIVTNSITLYSQSGLAPSTDKFNWSPFYDKLITSTLKDKKYIKTKEILATALNYKSIQEMDDNILNQNLSNEMLFNNLVSAYGESPLLTTILSAESNGSYAKLFDNIATFSNTLLTMIIAIIIIISMLAVISISIDLVNNAIPLNAMLKSIGFSDSSNIFGFLSIFFPTIILSISFSIPLTILFLSGFQSIIYSFSNILLSTFFPAWTFLIPTLGLIVLLGFTILIALIKIKRVSISNAISRY